MGTVTIGAKSYQVYGTLQGAIDYWNAGLGTLVTKWQAATPDQKSSSLVQATRLLDRQLWQGLPVTSPVLVDVSLAWPRSGVVDANSQAVPSTSVPDGVVAATYELAVAIYNDPTVVSSATSGKNIKRVKSGTTEVEFWASTLGITGRFATNVEEYVGQYLAGSRAATISGSASYGTDGTVTSQTAVDYDLTRGL